MDKNNIKDNILRQCHHHKKDGVEKVELRNSLMNDDLLDECCKELIDEDYITKQDPLYFIRPKDMILHQDPHIRVPTCQ